MLDLSAFALVRGLCGAWRLCQCGTRVTVRVGEAGDLGAELALHAAWRWQPLCGHVAWEETALRPLECGGVAAAPGSWRGAEAGPGRRASRSEWPSRAAAASGGRRRASGPSGLSKDPGFLRAELEAAPQPGPEK